MTTVVVTPTAAQDLDQLITTRSLPTDTIGRFRRSVVALETFPLIGAWATLAAGHASGSEAWCRRGLAITGAYAQLRAHCAMAALVLGEDSWTADVERAGVAAITYGDLLTDSADSTSNQIARSELSRASEDARALGSDRGAFATIADLSTNATRLSALAGEIAS
jgi:hypothetical protein